SLHSGRYPTGQGQCDYLRDLKGQADHRPTRRFALQINLRHLNIIHISERSHPPHVASLQICTKQYQALTRYAILSMQHACNIRSRLVHFTTASLPDASAGSQRADSTSSFASSTRCCPPSNASKMSTRSC